MFGMSCELPLAYFGLLQNGYMPGSMLGAIGEPAPLVSGFALLVRGQRSGCLGFGAAGIGQVSCNLKGDFQ